MSNRTKAAIRTSYHDEEPSPKRQKKRRDTPCPVEDYICPISLELPLDPVLAEDGRVYERASIEDYFHSCWFGDDSLEEVALQDVKLKSPITREMMGTKLFPSPPIKNTIEFFIETKFIKGDLANTWKAKKRQKEHMDLLFQKAEAGDSEAMGQIGSYYYQGIKGFPMKRQEAYMWTKRGHSKGNIKSTALLSTMYMNGHGVDKNTTKAIVLVALAAEKGVDKAAYLFGRSNAFGQHGLPVDKSEAMKWLQLSLNDNYCTIKQMSDKEKECAERFLLRLEAVDQWDWKQWNTGDLEYLRRDPEWDPEPEEDSDDEDTVSSSE